MVYFYFILHSASVILLLLADAINSYVTEFYINIIFAFSSHDYNITTRHTALRACVSAVFRAQQPNGTKYIVTCLDCGGANLLINSCKINVSSLTYTIMWLPHYNLLFNVLSRFECSVSDACLS